MAQPHPETVGTFANRCTLCNGKPRWSLLRHGDVIIRWACEDHLTFVLIDLLPTDEHHTQATVTDLDNEWKAPRR